MVLTLWHGARGHCPIQLQVFGLSNAYKGVLLKNVEIGLPLMFLRAQRTPFPHAGQLLQPDAAAFDLHRWISRAVDLSGSTCG